MLYTLLKSAAWLVLRICFRLRVRGAENIPDAGGVLIATNHQSFLDPIIVAASSRRPVSFMARDTLFRNPVFGRLIRRLGAFPVHRDSADRGAVREATSRLQSGAALLVFPEGRRTADGTLGELHIGPALLARRAGVPIVPGAIGGAFEAWPRGRRLFRFRPISIAYGRPFACGEGRERETHDALRRKLQNELEALMSAQHRAAGPGRAG